MTATVEPNPILEFAGVSKSFGATQALKEVSFCIYPGQVTGLVGDNGAGKSTIVKLITGYYGPSSGEILFNGGKVAFRSPATARTLGIEAVFQDLALIDELSLWRNFFLGQEIHAPRRLAFGVLNKKRMREICQRELDTIGLTRVTSVDGPASVLSGGEKQSLAITRAVYFGARLLLLDEPTAALSVRETQHVFDTIRQAREKGLGILYIDHNMAHIEPIADRILVAEHGSIVAEYMRGEVTAAVLAEILAHRPEKGVE